MQQDRIRVAIDAPKIDTVSALWSSPDGPTRNSAILLANGAGLHLDAPWMRSVADGLVERGFPVLQFNYPYKERSVERRKPLPPDRAPILEAAHRRALDALNERSGKRRTILAGKSLGARISTHLAAKDAPCAALVLFGYPLHPPKRPEKLRHEHFPAIVQPALFLQGTRDALCDLTLLTESLRTFGGRATVEVVEGADHGFHVLERSGRTEDEVLGAMLDRVVRFEEECFPD